VVELPYTPYGNSTTFSPWWKAPRFPPWGKCDLNIVDGNLDQYQYL